MFSLWRRSACVRVCACVYVCVCVCVCVCVFRVLISMLPHRTRSIARPKLETFSFPSPILFHFHIGRTLTSFFGASAADADSTIAHSTAAAVATRGILELRAATRRREEGGRGKQTSDRPLPSPPPLRPSGVSQYEPLWVRFPTLFRRGAPTCALLRSRRLFFNFFFLCRSRPLLRRAFASGDRFFSPNRQRCYDGMSHNRPVASLLLYGKKGEERGLLSGVSFLSLSLSFSFLFSPLSLSLYPHVPLPTLLLLCRSSLPPF